MMDKTFEEKIKVLKTGIDGLLDRISDKSEPYFNGQAVGLNYVKELIDITFPELKDSEDERIRKEIYNFLIDMECKKEWIAYLEKQKEQNTLSTEETELNSIAFLEQLGYTCVPPGAEQRPSTPEDIAAAYQMGLADRRKEQKPAECINIEKLAKHIKAEFEAFRNLLKKKGIDYQPTNVYWTDLARLFISSSKKLQKPAEWSKEDKEKFNRIYEILGYAADDKGFLKSKRIIGDKEAIELQDFLKSLRPQPHWKPSEEQMSCLWQASRYYKSGKIKITGKTLESLYNDLKKLM